MIAQVTLYSCIGRKIAMVTKAVHKWKFMKVTKAYEAIVQTFAVF